MFSLIEPVVQDHPVHTKPCPELKKTPIMRASRIQMTTAANLMEWMEVLHMYFPIVGGHSLLANSLPAGRIAGHLSTGGETTRGRVTVKKARRDAPKNEGRPGYRPSYCRVLCPGTLSICIFTSCSLHLPPSPRPSAWLCLRAFALLLSLCDDSCERRGVAMLLRIHVYEFVKFDTVGK